MNKYYPMMLNIYNQPCLVIGGGEVAQRKISSLLSYGANITLISPHITEKLNSLVEEGKIKYIKREYKEGDLKGYFLAYITTNYKKVNELCIKEARKEGVLVNIADHPKECDFFIPAVFHRGDLQVCISTNGKSPMLTKKIKEELKELFPKEYEEFIYVLGEIRKMMIKEVKDIHLRKEIFEKLVYNDVLEKYKNKEIKNIKEALIQLYKENIK
ncbi:precorrin-2 dehydrogenase/sirohydrochlorin ferrochelatase family protein [Inediibacterium massiliense]|uniref:precorrin-2 dehydrogenase/sirohydrochlorin ferrochelatase family protein n=1 Tax=Inediibacterium massiliense TaxID=1658111 RepID=UPI0006B540DC|nr:bifunctional precorrin-2 dehydrogenase/sirohydrochlorin ferrochelatase [Inediibacterium massiliense]